MKLCPKTLKPNRDRYKEDLQGKKQFQIKICFEAKNYLLLIPLESNDFPLRGAIITYIPKI